MNDASLMDWLAAIGSMLAGVGAVVIIFVVLRASGKALKAQLQANQVANKALDAQLETTRVMQQIDRNARTASLVCNCAMRQLSAIEMAALPDNVRESLNSPPEQLQISVFNAGPAPVIVMDIQMQVGGSKTKNPDFLDNPNADYYDPEYDPEIDIYSDFDSEHFQAFPVRLSNGDFTSWRILSGEADDPDQWIDSLMKGFVQTKREAETFKFILYTNQGQESILPEEEMLVRIIDAHTRSKTATLDQS